MPRLLSLALCLALAGSVGRALLEGRWEPAIEGSIAKAMKVPASVEEAARAGTAAQDATTKTPAAAAPGMAEDGTAPMGTRVTTAMGPSAMPIDLYALRSLRLRGADGVSTLAAVAFDDDGMLFPEADEALQRFFRHRKTEAARAVDPELVRLLLDVAEATEGRPITLVSGHRPPGRGTRRTSHHVEGRAADIAVEGMSTRALYRVLRELPRARGIGVYRHFVHVDVREEPRYVWSGG